jgi:hypothetical protein
MPVRQRTRREDLSQRQAESSSPTQASNARDQFGNGDKFITPMIVKGKVFVGTPNGVAVFGLLP